MTEQTITFRLKDGRIVEHLDTCDCIDSLRHPLHAASCWLFIHYHVTKAANLDVLRAAECLVKWLGERKPLRDYIADPSDLAMKRFAEHEHACRLWRKEKEGIEYRDTPTFSEYCMAKVLMERFAELELIRLSSLEQFMNRWQVEEIIGLEQ